MLAPFILAASALDSCGPIKQLIMLAGTQNLGWHLGLVKEQDIVVTRTIDTYLEGSRQC